MAQIAIAQPTLYTCWQEFLVAQICVRYDTLENLRLEKVISSKNAFLLFENLATLAQYKHRAISVKLTLEECVVSVEDFAIRILDNCRTLSRPLYC